MISQSRKPSRPGPKDSQTQYQTALRIIRPDTDQHHPDPISLNVVWPRSDSGLGFYSGTVPEEEAATLTRSLKRKEKETEKEL